MPIISPDRLIADSGPYGSIYKSGKTTHVPALSSSEVNEYWCSFTLWAGEEIQSTAWVTSPDDGLTLVQIADPELITVRERSYLNARGVRLSTPTVGTTYTIQCLVSTNRGRTLQIQFTLRGID